MIVLNDQVEIDSNSIYALDINFFKSIRQFGLIDLFLEGMEIKLQGLVFRGNKTPYVQCFIHWVLFKPG